MKSITFTLVALFFSLSISAQYKIGILPRTSPDRGIYEQIGYTGVEITYGSPSTNGRTIWGNIVNYDEVWRAGANDATRIEFSEDIEIDGNVLPRGIYSIFVIPRENKDWTVIFNTDYDQWGAFNYNALNDVLRIEVTPKRIDHQEKLEYRIENQGYEQGMISLSWSEVQLDIQFETGFLDILQREIEVHAENSPKEISSVIYLQGAEYLLRRNQNLDIASEWIDKAESLYDPHGNWSDQYFPREYILGHIQWTKAKILAAYNQYALAIDYAEKMKNLKGDYTYYEEEKDFEHIDEQITLWKSM